MLRILLVDDHAVVRAGYRRLLEQADSAWVVEEAATGEGAYKRTGQTPFDVVVMDLSLPGISGVEALRRMKRREPEVRVLVFSMHDQAVFAEQALEAGADGYITKSSAPEVLVEAVSRVAEGGRFLGADVQEAMVAHQGDGNPEDALRNLSPREFEIFRLLAEGRGVAEIAETLNLGYKTVANYSSIVRDKLGMANTADLTRLAIREGVVQP
ncbi:response regulator transcription factor [Methylonatrum kenyense]|uniref:response regulator n=1 Tax=Methylonatrum kenyense TaxID=455253 RepID=UPI0020BF8851|nr:response regulator transcription factor [Methylonatrum kenyense]MCK8517084.1 response regulator transcription factor [Methylonatrum kenyense]